MITDEVKVVVVTSELECGTQLDSEVPIKHSHLAILQHQLIADHYHLPDHQCGIATQAVVGA